MLLSMTTTNNADRVTRTHTAFPSFRALCEAMDQGYRPTVSKSAAPSLLLLLNGMGYTAFVIP